MNTIKKEFEKLKKQHPYLSSINIFFRTIKGTKLKGVPVARLFNNLVDKEDYSEEDYETLIDYAIALSNDNN